MGLTKAIVASDGQSGDYWRIKSYHDDPEDRVVTLILLQYKDRATRDAAPPNNKPMQPYYDMSFIGADYDTALAVAVLDVVGNNPRTELYPLVKAQSLDQIGVDLSDAVDDA